MERASPQQLGTLNGDDMGLHVVEYMVFRGFGVMPCQSRFTSVQRAVPMLPDSESRDPEDFWTDKLNSLDILYTEPNRHASGLDQTETNGVRLLVHS